MNKKAAVWFLISVALISMALAFVSRQLSAPDYPEDILYDKVIYAINPQTILASLERGESNIFQLSPPEPEGGWPVSWDPSSFSWNQGDYLIVTDALHLFIWKESLEDWHLIRASFQIDQCQDVSGKIDSANLSFFQRQGKFNIVHGFWINPMYGIVTAGNQYSHQDSWITKWKSIDLNKAKVNNVASALQLAEKSGGMEARFAVMNECKISLLLAPDRLEYGFFARPFNQCDWGWSVIYWSNKSDAEPIFSITIDPYSEEYETFPEK